MHKKVLAKQSGECSKKGLVQSTTVRFDIGEYLSVSEGLRTEVMLLLGFIEMGHVQIGRPTPCLVISRVEHIVGA